MVIDIERLKEECCEFNVSGKVYAMCFLLEVNFKTFKSILNFKTFCYNIYIRVLDILQNFIWQFTSDITNFIVCIQQNGSNNFIGNELPPNFNGVSLLGARFCGPRLCSMIFAAFTRPVEFIVAVH